MGAAEEAIGRYRIDAWILPALAESQARDRLVRRPCQRRNVNRRLIERGFSGRHHRCHRLAGCARSEQRRSWFIEQSCP